MYETDRQYRLENSNCTCNAICNTMCINFCGLFSCYIHCTSDLDSEAGEKVEPDGPWSGHVFSMGRAGTGMLAMFVRSVYPKAYEPCAISMS